ncbi:hypothetical protein [Flavobacterium terrae]|uniref:Tetratricopeptide repeat-containing protein n=1 Tax=Flavobacterium terrae TaxID=415425 RepID=A0A1M6DMQ5_9FLAO|nr:hypothetical protein [Flavobacterium terrae]SHI74431.1 hypothetical protein SAMN05444363_1534 [Flavobacterium terrae]
MNITEFTYLLNKPDAITENQTNDLSKIIEEFPYFQSARSIYLKGLHKQDSFKYNNTLKTTAAYTTDRTVLFDFITSEHFSEILPEVIQEKEEDIVTQDIIENNDISAVKIDIKEDVFENTLEKSILSSIQEAEQHQETINEKTETIVQEAEVEISEKAKEVETPVTFNQNEKHSFQEWLQLSKIKPIVREEDTNETSGEKSLTSKLEIIDKFIETNPKIPPVKEDVPPPTYTTKTEDTSYLMTETLAKVYLDQKKYSKAIQAYEILILKYPEKSSLFANRILDIKELQQNNK